MCLYSTSRRKCAAQQRPRVRVSQRQSMSQRLAFACPTKNTQHTPHTTMSYRPHTDVRTRGSLSDSTATTHGRFIWQCQTICASTMIPASYGSVRPTSVRLYFDETSSVRVLVFKTQNKNHKIKEQSQDLWMHGWLIA